MTVKKFIFFLPSPKWLLAISSKFQAVRMNKSHRLPSFKSTSWESYSILLIYQCILSLSYIYIYLTQSYASLGMWLVYPFLDVGVCPDEIIVLIARKEGENWYQEVTSNFSIISLYVSSLIFMETIIIMPIIEIRELKFRNGKTLACGPQNRKCGRRIQT